MQCLMSTGVAKRHAYGFVAESDVQDAVGGEHLVAHGGLCQAAEPIFVIPIGRDAQDREITARGNVHRSRSIHRRCVKEDRFRTKAESFEAKATTTCT